MLIVAASDNHYVPGVMVLFASAALHTPAARFALLDLGISPANRACIDRLAARLSRPIQRIEIAPHRLADLPVQNPRLTRAAYLRLLIPDLFPQEDRALYLDSDMLVTGDLTPLDRLDLGPHLCAAVADPFIDAEELASTGHQPGTYVNSGLLVMNLALWRAEGFADLCRSLVLTRPLRLEDQSALNIAARGRILLLDPRYNAFTRHHPDNGSPAPGLADPAVLHFTDWAKPWQQPCALHRLWQAYAAPIRDLLPAKDPGPARHALSKLNRRRKEWMRSLLGTPDFPETPTARRAQKRLLTCARRLMARPPGQTQLNSPPLPNLPPASPQP